MLRTICWFLYFWVYLIFRIPQMFHARKLDKAGLIEDRDAFVEKVARNWAQVMLRTAGGRVEITGNEQVPSQGSVVFVANHQGNCDIPVMIGYVARSKAFISKIEVLKLPLIRTWMRIMQCSFMNRKDMRQSARTIAEAVETIRSGYPMVIFPEGTRSKSDQIGDFKHGSFKLALKAGVPIVPVTIDGSWRILEQQGYLKPGTIKVTVHPPVPTEGLSTEAKNALPDKVRAIISSALPQG